MTKQHIEFVLSGYGVPYTDALADKLLEMFDEEAASYLHTINKLNKALLSKNKGEWIEVVTERFPNGEKRMWHYECSACRAGEPPCPITREHWNFCPNCGADMREVSE